jgi:hypothetical protein
MGMNRALEVLLLKLGETFTNMFPQGVADIEVLSGDLDLHGRGKILVSPLR